MEDKMDKRPEDLNDSEKALGWTEEEMVQFILVNADRYNMFSSYYIKYIIENIISDVMKDIVESADGRNFSMGDIQLAIGRVLCERLGVVI